jgi:RNA polymerase sigma factor (sigma-70 family)
MRGARSRSIFLLDDVGFRRFRMNGGTVEDSLATRAGRLFAQYRDGDQAKMGDLVRVLTPILWHIARSSRLDSATAEDVLQSAWLTLVRKSDTITEPLAVLQWMVVTTKREAWRVARNQARLRPEDLESATTAASNSTQSVEDTVLRDEGHTRLWRHIEALPKRCRTLLRVIAFADRPDYAELAKALGMPQGSIGPTRGRCLAKLRISLAQDPTWEHR